ncbi:hypothetical protein LTR97_001778 [Elasticomyces elasticus]|uniref:Uncharacterized protein n=1 Tax=Elasticomyces elasticus TaxID=574655 RepID=A0AAN7WIE1_9PEZI|nr:hypothetical protein LTR97_001778 [Elasticomyces elasticus]
MEIDPDDFQLLLTTGGRTGNAGRPQAGPQSMPVPIANPAPGPGAAMNVGGPQSGQEGIPAPGPIDAPNVGGQQGMPTSPAYPAPGPGAVPLGGGQQGMSLTPLTPVPNPSTSQTVTGGQGSDFGSGSGSGSNVAPAPNPVDVPSLQALAQRSDALRRQLLAMQGCPQDRIERSSQWAAGEIARRGEDARAELEANIVKVERRLAGVGVGGRERPSKSTRRRKKQKKGEVGCVLL